MPDPNPNVGEMPAARAQCPWEPAAIVRLRIERAAYERAGRPRGYFFRQRADVEAELAEVARRLGRPR